MLASFVILGFLIYSNTLNVPFHFDDQLIIQQNPHVRLSSLSFKDIWAAGVKSYASNRPIANISFALNYYFHQYNVVGYHVINITIHILTGMLLYLFIRTTLNLPALGFGNASRFWIAFFAALLWLVHPIQTQSVTYIVQRMNSMAAMFYVLSFLLYVKGRVVREKQKRWPWFAGCAFSGVLAIGSKEVAVTLPFFMLLYEWYFFQDLSKAWFRRHLCYMVGALILLGFFVFLYLGTDPFDSILSGYKHRDFTLTERVLTEFRVVIHYMSLLLYPRPSRLNLDYDFPLSHSLMEPVTTLFSVGVLVGLVGLAICIAKKERLISFCILWFLGNLVMESSVIALEIVYEHRAYLPSMFFFLLIIVLAYRFVKQQKAIIAVLSVSVMLFCVWTYERNSIWTDPVTLWRDCVNKSENKPRPHNNLALALYEQGRLDEAIVQCSEALRIKGDHPEIHNTLGAALAAGGQLDEAISHYLQALRIRPDYADAHNNLAAAMYAQGRLDDAMSHYSAALRIQPSSAQVHNNLGLVFARQGRLNAAIAQFREALRIMPAYAEGHNNLGTALHRQGKLAEAINHYNEALRIEPGYEEARRNLGIAMKEAGKAGRAPNSVTR
jgi:tetratricopeptide (TPR) repeat protein